ncbi:uncharacterized protein LOC132280989 [Cornus florida]|uniref:uncharacterized protein LOC132280989 n=1 Tax=Cornus florida TaxID=4283 RepID=UPI00289B6A18|nr:uncharacterized protein LOC132280989 [Cornus florida]
MALKIDITKAFDSVSWSFLLKTLITSGFNPIWIKWISNLLHSTRYSILVNGSPTGFIQPSKGLRQGCPLSPLLFTLVANQLSQLINTSISEGRLTLSNTALKAKSTCCHTFFADDLLITCKASVSNARTLKHIFKIFGDAAGLHINYQKSSVIFSKFTRRKRSILNMLQCKEDVFPFKYLGLPLSFIGFRKFHCNALIDKISKKLSYWSTKLLSTAGKVELIKPKDEGGLGVRKLKDLQVTSQCVLAWDFLLSKDRLWISWFHHRYTTSSNFWNAIPKISHSILWKNMINVRETLLNAIHFSIGDGQFFKAISDPWCEGATLLQKFGYRIVRRLGFTWNSSLSQLMIDGGWNFELLEEDIFKPIRDCLCTLTIHSRTDRLLWDRGNFTFKNVWESCRVINPEVNWSKICWGKARPRLSVNGVFLFQDRLSSMYNLQIRKVQLAPRCSLCLQGIDTRNHLFVQCLFARNFWKWLADTLD